MDRGADETRQPGDTLVRYGAVVVIAGAVATIATVVPPLFGQVRAVRAGRS